MIYAVLIGVGASLAVCMVVAVIFGQLLFRSIKGIATKRYAPFVPIPDEGLSLLEYIDIPKEYGVVYDLGCGDGKVLMYMASKFPQGTYIGIEYNLLPYILARVNTRKNSNITIKYKDFFKEDLSGANTVIVYLYPALMDVLLPKLEEELKAGTLLCSFDFAFAKKELQSIIYNDGSSTLRGRRLLTYRF